MRRYCKNKKYMLLISVSASAPPTPIPALSPTPFPGGDVVAGDASSQGSGQVRQAIKIHASPAPPSRKPHARRQWVEVRGGWGVYIQERQGM